VKTAKKTDKKRLEELKKKIHDKDYLDHAVTKIAQTLSEDLLQDD